MIHMTIGRWALAFAVSLVVHLTVVAAWSGTSFKAEDERAAGALAQLSVGLTPSQFYPSIAADEVGSAEVEDVSTAEVAPLPEPVDPVGPSPVNAGVKPVPSKRIAPMPSSAVATVEKSSLGVSVAEPKPLSAPVSLPQAPSPQPGSTLGAVSSVAEERQELASKPTEAAQSKVKNDVKEFKQAAIAKTTPVDTVVETKTVQPRKPAKRTTQPKKRKSKKKAHKAEKKKGKTSRKSRRASAASSARKGKARRKVGEGGRSSKAAGRAKLSNYLGRVLSKVRRQKRYPPAAERKRKGGTAIVAFTITKRGAVTGIRLKRRSGNAVLDREIINMVRRASPFPPIPKSTGRSRVAVKFPVKFKAH